jgi:hypothetical protein
MNEYTNLKINKNIFDELIIDLNSMLITCYISFCNKKKFINNNVIKNSFENYYSDFNSHIYDEICKFIDIHYEKKKLYLSIFMNGICDLNTILNIKNDLNSKSNDIYNLNFFKQVMISGSDFIKQLNIYIINIFTYDLNNKYKNIEFCYYSNYKEYDETCVKIIRYINNTNDKTKNYLILSDDINMIYNISSLYEYNLYLYIYSNTKFMYHPKIMYDKDILYNNDINSDKYNNIMIMILIFINNFLKNNSYEIFIKNFLKNNSYEILIDKINEIIIKNSSNIITLIKTIDISNYKNIFNKNNLIIIFIIIRYIINLLQNNKDHKDIEHIPIDNNIENENIQINDDRYDVSLSYISSLIWIFNKYICGNVNQFVYNKKIEISINNILSILKFDSSLFDNYDNFEIDKLKNNTVYYRHFNQKMYYVLCSPLIINDNEKNIDIINIYKKREDNKILMLFNKLSKISEEYYHSKND